MPAGRPLMCSKPDPIWGLTYLTPREWKGKQIQVFMLVLLTILPIAHEEALENVVLSFC